MSKPKVLVCQHGARHRYAIARILEEAGLLAALYTDSSAHSLLGRATRVARSCASVNVGRVSQRRVEGVPESKIYSSDAPLLSDVWASLFRHHESTIDKYVRRHCALSRQMSQWGLRDADVILCQSWESCEFIKYAKEQGRLIVVDVNGNPLNGRIMLEEALRLPGWGGDTDSSAVEQKERYFRRIADLADVLMCPSQWVAQGVATITPEHQDKIRTCPYGSSLDYDGRINEPVAGRLFFAGGAALRKGLPDIAQASLTLKKRIPNMEFRIAGIMDRRIHQMPECANLNFLGKLSWRQICQEYLSADVFVFPTRSEGLAGVVLEAVAAGCPVITTRRAGIGITDSVDGIIVEPGDVGGLVDALERVYQDREYRNALSRNALHLAETYTLGAWKSRLVDLITSSS